jgi:hypothetical protein
MGVIVRKRKTVSEAVLCGYEWFHPIFFSLLVLVVMVPAPSFAQGAQIFQPLSSWENPQSVTVSQEELFLDLPYAKDWQDRTFYFTGRLDTGISFVICLFRWSFPVASSWGLLVAVTDERGRAFQYEDTVPWANSDVAEKGFHFRFGDNFFDDEGTDYRVKILLKGFSCDLKIRTILPPWKPGDGWAYFTPGKEAFIHYTSPSPCATVDGTMTVFGETVDAQGQCYWDSTLSVTPLSKPSSPQFSFRAFSPAGTPAEERVTVGMFAIYPNESFGSFSVPMLLVTRGGSWVFTSQDFFLAAQDWKTYSDPPYPYPTRYSVSAKQGQYALDGDFVSERVYSITDVLQKLPKFLRPSASAFFKRPVIFRTVGAFKGTLTLADGTVVDLNLPAQSQYAVVK